MSRLTEFVVEIVLGFVGLEAIRYNKYCRLVVD